MLLWCCSTACYLTVALVLFGVNPHLGELQRKIGLKVLEMGGNAVVGYLQCFDLEGESGLVVRAIGTACTLDKLSSGSVSNTNTNTHVHPTAAAAPPFNACNSPSKDGKEWVWNNDTCMILFFFFFFFDIFYWGCSLSEWGMGLHGRGRGQCVEMIPSLTITPVCVSESSIVLYWQCICANTT